MIFSYTSWACCHIAATHAWYVHPDPIRTPARADSGLKLQHQPHSFQRKEGFFFLPFCGKLKKTHPVIHDTRTHDSRNYPSLLKTFVYTRSLVQYSPLISLILYFLFFVCRCTVALQCFCVVPFLSVLLHVLSLSLLGPRSTPFLCHTHPSPAQAFHAHLLSSHASLFRTRTRTRTSHIPSLWIYYPSADRHT